MNKLIICGSFLFCSLCLADVLPVPDKTGRRLLPDETKLQIDSEYKRRLEDQLKREQGVEVENESLRRQLENMQKLRTTEPSMEGGGLNNNARVKGVEKAKPPKSDIVTTPIFALIRQKAAVQRAASFLGRRVAQAAGQSMFSHCACAAISSGWQFISCHLWIRLLLGCAPMGVCLRSP